MNLKEEVIKCRKDIVYFIENYCTINDNSIKLLDYQKNLLIRLNHANQQASQPLTKLEASETNG